MGLGSMIMPQMDQVPLYNSVNFLSVAYAQNNTCSTTLLNCFICPSDGGPSLVPVLGNPPDPANPGTVQRFDRRRHRGTR